MRKRWVGGVAAVLVAGCFLSLIWPVSGDRLRNGSVQSLRITDRNGYLLREVRPDGRGRPIPLDEIAPDAVAALIATEDRHFHSHPGINPFSFVRSAIANLRAGRIVSGGSTITMQVARTLRGRSNNALWDKLAEIHLALRLEVHLSKDEILALWLNRVPFGNQTYGIEAASQLYFGKPARDLSTAEAAFLIGLPQSPTRYNPYRAFDLALARQKRVLDAMVQTGRLDESRREEIEALPINLARARPIFRAPHLTEGLIAGLPADRNRPVEIRTTIDWPFQQAVEELMRGHMGRLRSRGATNAAVVVLDNATGDVLAYAGSVDFWDSRNGGQNDGVQMLRQPGSALKPFTYAHALASGRYTPASILPDIELQVPEAGGAFSPRNYDEQYHGPTPLRQALACSYNIPAVRLAREFGAPALLRTLRQSGFESLNRPPDFYGVGLTLGNGEVRLIELARAYAGLARGGSLPPVRYEIHRVTEAGDTLYADSGTPHPTGIDPAIAHLITDILSDSEAREPAFGRGGPLELPFPCAVKTGTSKDYRDNWTVGYTPRHTVAVWVGNFDGSPMQWISGVTGAAPIFKAVFQLLGSGGAFEEHPRTVKAQICPASGLQPGAACPGARTEVFLAGTVPPDTCNVHQILRIDRRTGLLAGNDTPESEVVSELFTVYSPEYHPWMQEQGMRLPPVAYTTLVAAGNDSLRYTDRLIIQYPTSGATFQIDPVLRPEYQHVRLVGNADRSLTDVSWWVDDQLLSTSFDKATWMLTPGTHRIELRAHGHHGESYRSRPVTIHVRDSG